MPVASANSSTPPGDSSATSTGAALTANASPASPATPSTDKTKTAPSTSPKTSIAGDKYRRKGDVIRLFNGRDLAGFVAYVRAKSESTSDDSQDDTAGPIDPASLVSVSNDGSTLTIGGKNGGRPLHQEELRELSVGHRIPRGCGSVTKRRGCTAVGVPNGSRFSRLNQR